MLLFLLQAALQVGGHGERLHQCREVLLTTSKAIPMQVDGEPCKLGASRICISLRNQANMVQKTKRRNSMPLLNEYVLIDRGEGGHPQSCGTRNEGGLISENAIVTFHDYLLC